MNMPKVVSRLALGLLTGASLLAIGGCSLFEGKKPDQPQCPRISVLADAYRETRFQAGKGHDLTDVELEAQVSNFKGSCLFDFDKRIMNIKMQLSVDGKLGPAAKSRKAEVAYFVAIPAYFPKPEAKKVVPVTLDFPAGNDRVRYTDDEVQLSIPIKDLRDLAAYEIFVGMQLNEEEVDFNRTHKQ